MVEMTVADMVRGAVAMALGSDADRASPTAVAVESVIDAAAATAARLRGSGTLRFHLEDGALVGVEFSDGQNLEVSTPSEIEERVPTEEAAQPADLGPCPEAPSGQKFSHWKNRTAVFVPLEG